MGDMKYPAALLVSLVLWGVFTYVGDVSSEKREARYQTPNGHSQIMKQKENDSIKLCAQAAEKGLICPGYKQIQKSRSYVTPPQI